MAPKNKNAKDSERFRDVAQNRRALHEYAITDRFEAGIVLQGSEVIGFVGCLVPSNAARCRMGTAGQNQRDQKTQRQLFEFIHGLHLRISGQ